MDAFGLDSLFLYSYGSTVISCLVTVVTTLAILYTVPYMFQASFIRQNINLCNSLIEYYYNILAINFFDCKLPAIVSFYYLRFEFRAILKNNGTNLRD